MGKPCRCLSGGRVYDPKVPRTESSDSLEFNFMPPPRNQFFCIEKSESVESAESAGEGGGGEGGITTVVNVNSQALFGQPRSPGECGDVVIVKRRRRDHG